MTIDGPEPGTGSYLYHRHSQVYTRAQYHETNQRTFGSFGYSFILMHNALITELVPNIYTTGPVIVYISKFENPI